MPSPRFLLAALLLSLAGTAGAREKVVSTVPPATSAVTVDAVLDEPAWRDALRLELAYEVRPGDNVTPPVRTEALITYDQDRLLVAFRAYDPDPSAIRARYRDRDDLFEDDWLGVALDTFNDQRRAYEFTCNPLGVQMDAVNDDVSGDYDTSWDAIWESAGRVTAEGFVVEMAIPFSQIRFQPTSGPQTWGIDLFRSWPRKDRHHIGLWPRDRGANSYLAQEDKIVGFAGVSRGRNLEVTPTLIASREEAREDFSGGEMKERSSDAELGVTARWGLSPGTTLSAAVNPDFSQVEADAIQLDVNERFALFYEEKRPFFLEGADFFDTDLDLVHTRTIADPAGALKLTGKSGRHTFGLFTAADQVTNLVFPGSEGSESGSFDLDSQASVGRYRFDFGDGSVLGAMVTDREGGDYSNRVASADLRYRFGSADTLNVSAAWSATRYDQEMVTASGLAAGKLTDRALTARYSHSVRDWYLGLYYWDFGDDFRADLGHVTQVGFREGYATAQLIWYGDEGELYNELKLGLDVDYMTEQDGDLLNREAQAALVYEGPYESSVVLGLGGREQVFRSMSFEQLFGRISGELWPRADLYLRLAVQCGEAVDYEHGRPADRLYLQPHVAYSPGRHLRLALTHTYSTLEVEGGRLFTANAPELWVVYQVNVRAFLRAVIQYTRLRRDPGLYAAPVAALDEDLTNQLLFSYTLNPQSVLYLGYSDGYRGSEELGLKQTGRTLFVKLGYAWLW